MAGGSKLKVLFDENMSSRVAKALALVGKDVQRTNAAKPGKPANPDVVVARRARSTGRVLFTNNFDCVVAAVNEDTRLIWFYDHKNNSPTLFNQAWLFFRKWDDWEERFAKSDLFCLRVSMGRTTPITKEAAMKQASALDRRSKRQRRRAKAHASATQLSFD
ncbi:MAG: DUF5615 family PIN-like protein [Acidimicrobiales bacterium]